ncbi:YciE/YciF ferroxidase family protein [Fulvivirga sediminis]|uniref:DUF892 family protein n=1 Tax=Fulvivirga sediminis TaxID=2803949 RepID=A0A937K1P4_9BACT|nr:DUF892 family protein [Fulvivirga sediminis]MBL3656907.1 DUF892 family protein [Fulvivirga sediminis]
MSKKKTLQDLLEHELRDLYSAETQMLNVLPIMVSKTTDQGIQKTFEAHYKEIKQQKRRLEESCMVLDITPEGHICIAIAGIIQELTNFLKEGAEAEVIDAKLIAQLHRMEHYEIAGYGAILHYARCADADEVADLVMESLEQKKDAADELTKLAEEKINEHIIA